MRGRLFILVAVAGLGLALRVAEYARNRSLWHDEARFANSLVARHWESVREREYARPLGYLATSRALVTAFGNGERVVRLPAFLASLLSLGLFFLLASVASQDFGARLASVALFSLGSPLVYFSAEAKHYSLEVCLAVAMGLAFEARTERGLVALALLGVASPWLGFGALFVAAPLCLFADASSRARAASLVAMATSAAIALALQKPGPEGFLSTYWAPHFLPGAPSEWWQWAARHFDWLSTRTVGVDSPVAALLLGALGAAAVGPRRRVAWLAPVAAALFAAGLGLYPFYERLLLFSVPGLCLLLGEGFAALFRRRAVARPVAVGLAFVAMAPLVARAGSRLVVGAPKQELREVLARLAARHAPGDAIYVYYGAAETYRYYAPRLGLPLEGVEWGKRSREDWRVYAGDVSRLDGRGRTWVVFTRVFDLFGASEEKLFLHHLDLRGPRLDAIREPGASAYLYDLRSKERFRSFGKAAAPAGGACRPPREASMPSSLSRAGRASRERET